MSYEEFETSYVENEIGCCEDIEDLREKISTLLVEQKKQWTSKINSMIQESGLKIGEFANRCGTNRVTLNKWRKGSIPRDREKFLKIGMATGYDEEKMNELLQKYGRYPGLYAKSLEDCVCIFVLNKKYGDDTVAKYDEILSRMKAILTQSDRENYVEVKTSVLDTKLSDVGNEEELERFVIENTDGFTSAFHDLYSFVLSYIKNNHQSFGIDNIYNLAQVQGWSSSLRQCVSAISQHKWYPTRKKIISLGLHLCMDREQIDEMLMFAKMRPLYVKNIFESVIIFILTDAELNGKFEQEADDYNPDYLCNYANEILKELDIAEVKEEIESFLAELSGVNEDEW